MQELRCPRCGSDNIVVGDDLVKVREIPDNKKKYALCECKHFDLLEKFEGLSMGSDQMTCNIHWRDPSGLGG